jgi:sn-glycerol 3-phosphate transport system permease protein
MMVIAIWKEAGFFMISYLAALQAIPPVLYEAASVGGASRFTVLRRIT